MISLPPLTTSYPLTKEFKTGNSTKNTSFLLKDKRLLSWEPQMLGNGGAPLLKKIRIIRSQNIWVFRLQSKEIFSSTTKQIQRVLTNLSSNQSESKMSVACLWSRVSTFSPDLGGCARFLQDSHCTALRLHAMNVGIHGTQPFAASIFLSVALKASIALTASNWWLPPSI